MADTPYRLHSLELEGFRAFKSPKTFYFGEKRNLAIFAPNGYGKSSVVDALEFMFSREGTLDRLGLKAMHNRAGPSALAHNLADGKSMKSAVTISFFTGSDSHSCSRAASGGERMMPPEIMPVCDCFAANPIVRGYSLRSFVEDSSPEERYKKVAEWLQFGSLVQAQTNLRNIRKTINAAAKKLPADAEFVSRLQKQTSHELTSMEKGPLIHFVNSKLRELDDTLEMHTLEPSDKVYAEIRRRAKEEERQIGLAMFRQLYKLSKQLQSMDDSGKVNGLITDCEAAASKLIIAIEKEKEEKTKAAYATFKRLWDAAEPLFREDQPQLDSCPICATPIEKTTAGSLDGIRSHIRSHMEDIRQYADAKEILERQKIVYAGFRTSLIKVLQEYIDLLRETHPDHVPSVEKFFAKMCNQQDQQPPNSDEIRKVLVMLIRLFSSKIKAIETDQGDHTYSAVVKLVEAVLQIVKDYESEQLAKSNLRKLIISLKTVSEFINMRIREKMQELLDVLQTPINDYYKLIQGANAKPIRLALPMEGEQNLQRLNIEIDFAKNRKGVKPTGYLSDSQLHTLALAYRIAAIEKFNSKAPIIVLDDIVTSYDADYRRKIAGLIAGLADKQVIIATHDERFYCYLQDQLRARDWQFCRIISFDPEHGPRFSDDKITEAMLEAMWKDGLSAGNNLRQAEEEWLLQICRDFNVCVNIRPIDKPYFYERSELAAALASFLKSAKLVPAVTDGVGNSFLLSLQKGVIENFASHFQDGTHGSGSIGDEKQRWSEFKSFRDQFVCPKCGSTRFKRPRDFHIPVCAKGKCEAQFEFSTTT